jgi:hypothetical protein
MVTTLFPGLVVDQQRGPIFKLFVLHAIFGRDRAPRASLSSTSMPDVSLPGIYRFGPGNKTLSTVFCHDSLITNMYSSRLVLVLAKHTSR